VIDYDEQSPFHAFDARHVVLFGESYEPSRFSQHLITWHEGRTLGHFRVSQMRLVHVTPDADLLEVGTGYELRGRFERVPSDTAKSILAFVSEQGDEFLVVNDPAGATLGRSVEVWAYPVQPSAATSGSPARHLWVICPCSAADIWEW